MTYYGGREMADAFRTVRKHTIQIADEIPDDQYGYRATPEVLSIAQELAHIACAPMWQIAAHGTEKKSFITFEDFHAYMGRLQTQEQALTDKAQILDALRRNGDEFARFLESLSPEILGERVGFPPPVQPSSKTRFEMLLGAKEHEMHHRGKLMLVQRLLGQIPHLTRARQQMQAPSAGGAARR